MKPHYCRTCIGLEASERAAEAEIVHMIRTAASRPGTLQASNSLARIPMLKARLGRNRQILAEHRAEMATS